MEQCVCKNTNCKRKTKGKIRCRSCDYNMCRCHQILTAEGLCKFCGAPGKTQEQDKLKLPCGCQTSPGLKGVEAIYTNDAKGKATLRLQCKEKHRFAVDKAPSAAERATRRLVLPCILKALENKEVHKLDLRECHINDEMMKTIIAELGKNCTITELDLYGNEFGPKGTELLAEVLKSNTVLTSLDLFNNSIGGEGAKAIARAIRENRTLTSLRIDWRSAGVEGVRAIAEALENNSTLTTVDLGKNMPRNEVYTRILRKLDANRAGIVRAQPSFDLETSVTCSSGESWSKSSAAAKVAMLLVVEEEKKPAPSPPAIIIPETPAKSSLNKNRVTKRAKESAKETCDYDSIPNEPVEKMHKFLPSKPVYPVKALDGQTLVLKIVTCTDKKGWQEEDTKREYDTGKELSEKTPYVVKPLQYQLQTSKEGTICKMVFEFGGDSLANQITKTVPSTRILTWIRQSLHAFVEAAKLGIVHSDIKPDNMVVTEDVLKIIDFGSCIVMKLKSELFKSMPYQFYTGTLIYLPPEIVNRTATEPHHGKVDVYCWGMTFYQVFTRKPREALEQEQDNFKRSAETYEQFLDLVRKLGKSEDKLKKQMAPILEAALAYEPDDRPTFAALLLLVSAIELQRAHNYSDFLISSPLI